MKSHVHKHWSHQAEGSVCRLWEKNSQRFNMCFQRWRNAQLTGQTHVRLRHRAAHAVHCGCWYVWVFYVAGWFQTLSVGGIICLLNKTREQSVDRTQDVLMKAIMQPTKQREEMKWEGGSEEGQETTLRQHTATMNNKWKHASETFVLRTMQKSSLQLEVRGGEEADVTSRVRTVIHSGPLEEEGVRVPQQRL